MKNQEWRTKHTTYESYDPFTSEPRIEILSKKASDEKTNKIAMLPDMLDFFNSIKIDSDNKAYLLINVMGASDFYGCNLNGDWFDEEDLLRYYKTFEQGHVFSNHKNEDPSHALGRILFASYNPIMHRVELLVEVWKDDPRAQKILQQIEAGALPRVSMGCRVMYDVCTICGNKARTRHEYCVHCRDGRLGKLNPDGTRNAVKNPHPRFFDISFVIKEADNSSGFLAKVASDKNATEDKESSMEKEIPAGEVVENVNDAVGGEKEIVLNDASKIDNADNPLPEELLDLMGGFSMPEICSTMGALRMKLKPEEFTYLALKPSVGRRGAGMFLAQRKRIGPVVIIKKSGLNLIDYSKHYNPRLASLLFPHMSKRSFYPGCYENRKKAPKIARHGDIQNSSLMEMYGSYVYDLKHEHPTAIANLLDRQPELKLASVGLVSNWETLKDPVSHYKTASENIGMQGVLVSHNMLLGAYANELK